MGVFYKGLELIIFTLSSRKKNVKNGTMTMIKTMITARKKVIFSLLFCFIAAVSFSSNAQSSLGNIVGQWKSIDDKTGKAKSIIEITEQNGVYTGRIIKLLNPSEPNPVCSKCKDERKNQAIEGMTIIENVSKKKKSWGGGTILDPKNGKIYKVRFKLVEEGKTLKVRGYIGLPTLGRTQTWERIKPKALN